MTGVALAVAVLGPAASAAPLPRADLAIGSNHVNHATASVGDLVRFTIIAVDKGPAPSNMDVAERLPGGLALVSETCDQGISADTPLCEYIEDPGVAVTTVVVARVLPSAHGRVLTPRACVMGEGGTFDPRRADNCLALTLTIRD
jgi:uncharacterized repeat protein (TIGR01451 family)